MKNQIYLFLDDIRMPCTAPPDKLNHFVVPKYYIHSANPVGAANIEKAMKSALRFTA